MDKAENTEASYAFVVLQGELYAAAVTPLLATDPIAWLCPACRIDDTFAREIKTYSDLEITFVDPAAKEKIVASTRGGKVRQSLLTSLSKQLPASKQVSDMEIEGSTLSATHFHFSPREGM